MILTDSIDPMLPRWYRIRRRQDELPNIVTFELEETDNSKPLPFSCGQFNMLYAFGVGEIPISISGDPDHPEQMVHTIRAVGNVSSALCAMQPGAVLGVRGPFGHSWPLEQARGKDLLLIAGGVGLAPLRSVMYHVIAHREDFGRVTLLYGARTPEDILYRADCEHWRGRLDLDVVVTVDRASERWRGSVGVVPKLIGRAFFDPLNTLAFVCGPEIMMRFVVNELERCGVPCEGIYISMERNMKCAIGHCGHCQYGPTFVCKDGPVLAYRQVRDLLFKREI
ncbi:Ni/Fe hydrogenase subunit gamma [Dictyobacter sp. S3.2.2.5]|uniref:Ni/Fe hydrogenase subunit gamma n=1 Tax=Dictyobacter halimunensis TaxID=3026934 RepID=A0ABQ6FM21_9CHLR|nr:Ni/Fe hydrogenase subunit gamma [Dictyobacter sp. S3.2.2.5]